MRARRGGTLVYTERGLGAGVEIVPKDVAGDTHAACIHGGFQIGKVLICGHCGDPELQLGLAISFIARKAAFDAFGKASADDDMIGAAALALWMNQDKILKAQNPGGLAYVIGKKAAMRVYRSRRFSVLDEEGNRRLRLRQIPVSQLNLPAENEEGDELETLDQRLDFLQRELVHEEMEEDWRELCSARGREFPGLDLVMSAANFLLLRRTIEEARQNISLDEWRVIDLRLDLDDDGECLTWREISKVTPFKFNDLPVIYQRALGVIRDYIVARLITKPST